MMNDSLRPSASELMLFECCRHGTTLDLRLIENGDLAPTEDGAEMELLQPCRTVEEIALVNTLCLLSEYGVTVSDAHACEDLHTEALEIRTMGTWDIGMRHIVDVDGQLLAIDARVIDTAGLLALGKRPADRQLWQVRAGEHLLLRDKQMIQLSEEDVLFFESTPTHVASLHRMAA